MSESFFLHQGPQKHINHPLKKYIKSKEYYARVLAASPGGVVVGSCTHKRCTSQVELGWVRLIRLEIHMNFKMAPRLLEEAEVSLSI
jgi:hypothetical protein